MKGALARQIRNNMAKIRLNPYSQFEIECCIDGISQWRLAVHPLGDFDKWEPEFDPDTEILQEDDSGTFWILTK